VPGSLRPLLRFRGRLSATAIETLIRSLDDDDFRAAVAADGAEDAVGRAGWLFLERPEGWEEELGLMVDAERDRIERDRSDADERSAVRRAGQLEQALVDLQRRLDAASADAATAQDSLDEERARRREAEAASRDLEVRLEVALAERRDAVAELTAARADAAARREDLRRAGSELAVLVDERQHWIDPVTDAVADAHAALGEAAAALDAALAGLTSAGSPPGLQSSGTGPAGTQPADLDRAGEEPARRGGRGSTGPVAGTAGGDDRSDSGGVGGARRRRGAPPRRHRLPIRLERGALDGTIEATDQLMRTADVAVVVDGYSVTMEGWPHLDARSQRDRLISFLGTAAARSAADVHVVFDGSDEGGRPAVSAPLAVRVRYTPGDVEADDVVVAMAQDLPPERPVVVVSSDRRVQDGARAAGANVVSSSALLAWGRR